MPPPPVSLHSSKPLLYSMEWAESVFQELRNKYPRATEIFLETFQLTPRQAALYLAKGDPLWPRMRACVKRYDNWLHRGWNGIDTTQALSQEVWGLRRTGDNRLAERLDSLAKSGKLRIAAKQGESGAP